MPPVPVMARAKAYGGAYIVMGLKQWCRHEPRLAHRPRSPSWAGQGAVNILYRNEIKAAEAAGEMSLPCAPKLANEIHLQRSQARSWPPSAASSTASSSRRRRALRSSRRCARSRRAGEPARQESTGTFRCERRRQRRPGRARPRSISHRMRVLGGTSTMVELCRGAQDRILERCSRAARHGAELLRGPRCTSWSSRTPTRCAPPLTGPAPRVERIPRYARLLTRTQSCAPVFLLNGRTSPVSRIS